ncbi:MAG: phosphoenolpyruvate carboxykinase [Candidatus Altiarchaeales archaeon]|nr:phosphoenolpyruvate carboxykinase [Candidatus Altiarchaeales archaeon]MBD3415551.1 phosphoenolpyruvate carboxykinase [Candidatus Altiarchaeales archaeon]
MSNELSKFEKTFIVWTDGSLPKETYEFLDSRSFSEIVGYYLDELRMHESNLLRIFPQGLEDAEQVKVIVDLFKKLYYNTVEDIERDYPEYEHLLGDRYNLQQFIENLYNFWRGFERYIVCSSLDEMGYDKRPYRTFRDTISHMNHLVRKTYRDISENLMGESYNVYRQVSSGFSVGIIAVNKEWGCPDEYMRLDAIPMVTQVLLYPPLILDPLMNKRKGSFKKVESNPLEGIEFQDKQWLCYPAKVGSLLIHIYFHNKFMSLGCSAANLFELAKSEDLERKPDAIYAFGVDEDGLDRFGCETVFYEDEKNDLLIAAVPRKNDYGYFGYLKKMVLTLHNILMMKRGRFPIHGAMVGIELKEGRKANVVIVGDTGAGKSESLEAFRTIGDAKIKDMTIIFDDMGSLEVDDEGRVKAYGTEIGAFVRLDDLQPGFAFGNIDRSIIMSPQKVNARVVLPVTTIEEVLRGNEVDFFLYANNYEEIGEKEEIIERFGTADEALRVFSEGKVMSKGTTESSGVVKTYFANIFGPPQYKELHDNIATRYFGKMFETGVFVGQVRTRLGIEGYETEGPMIAAQELLKLIDRS